LVRKALIGSIFDNPSYFAAAPTFAQAKRIYWEDIKRLIPKQFVAGKPSESALVVNLINGASIHVLGLDAPERIEGTPWDGGILDEYGNMKEFVWPRHVRPALSDRNGWCWLIGVPEGRNHYYKTFQRAIGDASGEWSGFTWESADILPPEEIEAARRDLDELTFNQEYRASFVSFEGRAYYSFTDANKFAGLRRLYQKRAPLILCFDFNVDPGVAAIIQEIGLPGIFEDELSYGGVIVGKKPVAGTACLGEVYIPRNSNTPAVCRKIIQDWGEHQGDVFVYGDSTGGNRGTAKVIGSDWDIVKNLLRQHFKDRVFFRVPAANPSERSRINAVNSRCRSLSGKIRFMVDSESCRHVVDDFDGVGLLVGGSGEIDKKKDPMLSHITDAIGYYIAEKFPVGEKFKMRLHHGDKWT
jgi:hypothetical protein